ncbi:LOW QUALITY PROTEIN: hypothetical protein U0070_000393 [Myodes glareolus]|uniref:Small ribosomal subunit protein uS5 n=1 Tax=Myodes glareolus TaxID=447135 RepID=A0AAW0IAI4_MYOGA
MKIKSLEIYLFSLAIKKSEIIDFFPGRVPKKDEVLKITPVRSRQGSRLLLLLGTAMSTLVLSVPRRSEESIILAKLSIVPVWRGYWGNKTGKPHTVPCKVTGRCGSVLVRLILAPRGTAIASAPVSKKLLMMAGIDAYYTSARG